MRRGQLSMTPLEIPFRTSFKHASAERAMTESVWVDAVSADGKLLGHGEGCPRAYVTGENVSGALAWFERHYADILASVTGLESLKAWLERHSLEIDHDPAAWCAVELALLDLFGRETGQSLESLLSLPDLAESYRYSAVIGDGSDEAFQNQAEIREGRIP